jgi:hypothetical protein
MTGILPRHLFTYKDTRAGESWGAFETVAQAPWLTHSPGVAIFLVVLACNFFGDARRDVLDPKLRGTRRAGIALLDRPVLVGKAGNHVAEEAIRDQAEHAQAHNADKDFIGGHP